MRCPLPKALALPLLALSLSSHAAPIDRSALESLVMFYPPAGTFGVTDEGVMIYPTEDSPLLLLGLAPRDLITAREGGPVDSVSAILSTLDALLTEDAVTLTVRRDGVPLTLRIDLRGAPLPFFITPALLPTFNPDALEVHTLERSMLTSSPSLEALVGLTPHVNLSGRGDGLEVSALPPGSPLHRMGWREGDVLHALDGAPLTGEGAPARLLGALQTRDAVTLELTRGDRPLRLVLTSPRAR